MSKDLITILAFGLGTAITLTVSAMPIWVKVPLTLFFLCMTFAAICKVSPSQRPWLERLFTPSNRGTLYFNLVEKPSTWPRGWTLYDWAFRLALLYPFAAILITWAATGRPMYLAGTPEQGGIEVFPENTDWWPRIALVVALVLSGTIFEAENRAAASNNALLRKLSGFLVYIALIPMGFLSYYLSGLGAGAVVIALGGVLFIAGAIFVEIRAIGIGAYAAAVAAAIALGYSWLVPVASGLRFFVPFVPLALLIVGIVWLLEIAVARGYAAIGAILTTLALGVMLIVALAMQDWSGNSARIHIMFLFIGVLPLANAVFDYPSYALTLTLLRRGYDHPAQALFWALVDLLAALAFFFVTGAVLVLAVAYANQLAGVELYPIAGLLSDVGRHPMQYWWLYIMAFSTVVPTMAHLSVATFSTSAWFLPGWRAWVLKHLDDDDAANSLEVISLIAVFFMASLTLPFVFLFLLAAAGNLIMPGYLGTYLGWLQDIACWAGPSSCPIF